MYVAKEYNDSNDLDSHLQHLGISFQSQQLIWALTTPDQMPISHGINMVELLAIYTFMKLKVLEAIGQPSSISLNDLSKATGTQDSLLEGRMARPRAATGFIDQAEVQPQRLNSSELEYECTKFSLAYTIPCNHHQQQQETKPGHFFTVLYNQRLRFMLDFTDSYLPFVAALAHNRNLNHPYSSHPSFTSSFSLSFSFPTGSTGSLARGVREFQDPLFHSFTFAYGKYSRSTAWEIIGQCPKRPGDFPDGDRGVKCHGSVCGTF